MGGTQIIHDAGNKLDVTTELFKFPAKEHGGSWGVRVRGSPRPDAEDDLKSTMVFYVGSEGRTESSPACRKLKDKDHDSGAVECLGEEHGLGNYRLLVSKSKSNSRSARIDDNGSTASNKTFVHSLAVSRDSIWQAKCEHHLFPIM